MSLIPAYNFNYWVCESCAHTWECQEGMEAPSNCENCRSPEISGFTTLDEAEELSQEIMDEA